MFRYIKFLNKNPKIKNINSKVKRKKNNFMEKDKTLLFAVILGR